MAYPVDPMTYIRWNTESDPPVLETLVYDPKTRKAAWYAVPKYPSDFSTAAEPIEVTFQRQLDDHHAMADKMRAEGEERSRQIAEGAKKAAEEKDRQDKEMTERVAMSLAAAEKEKEKQRKANA